MGFTAINSLTAPIYKDTLEAPLGFGVSRIAMTQTLSNSTTEVVDLKRGGNSVEVGADKFESSPSLRAIANYIKKTSVWDLSLLKKEVV